MEQDLHHPSPRLPDGWKQFQGDNIDITTTSDINTGRHSRSPSVMSNHNYPQTTMNMHQMQQHNNGHLDIYDTANPNSNSNMSGDVGIGHHTTLKSQFNSETLPHYSTTDEFDFTPETRSSSGGNNNSYFHPTANPAPTVHTAANSTATLQPSLQSNNTLIQNTSNPLSPSDQSANSNNTFEDYYLSTDPSTPFLPTSNPAYTSTSPPIVQQDTLSPFAPYQNSFDQQHYTQYNEPSSNNLGLHWSHHRSLSEQSDLSSNASPFIGSVHSEHNSPFINPQQDNNFEDDLREAILGLDMGAQFDVTAQHYNTTQFDTSTLELDQQGFPVDAPLFDRQEYYDHHQQQQNSSPKYLLQLPSRKYFNFHSPLLSISPITKRNFNPGDRSHSRTTNTSFPSLQ
jgi:hypothetical protein